MTVENVKPSRPVQQPRVVDVSRPGGAGLTVEIDGAEAAELLLSIATLLVEDEQDTYELGEARIQELRAGDAARVAPRGRTDPPLQVCGAAARPGLHDAEAAHGGGVPRPRGCDRRRRDPPPHARLLHAWPPCQRAGDAPARRGRRRRRDRRDPGGVLRVPRSGEVLRRGGCPPHRPRRVQAGAPRSSLGLVRARPARGRARGLSGAPRTRRRGEARARTVGSSRAGRRAAGARHPVGARGRRSTAWCSSPPTRRARGCT